MKKTIIAGIAAGMMLLLGFTVHAVNSTELPIVTHNSYNGDMVITGSAESGSFVTLKILKLGLDYSALTTADKDDALYYCNQVTAKENEYTFSFKFNGESGVYKASVIDSAQKTGVKFDIAVTDKGDYAEFVNDLNKAAKEGYDAFVSMLEANQSVLGFDYELPMTDEAKENFCAHVKKNGLRAEEYDKNVQIYRNFVLMEQVKKDGVVDITKYLDDIYFEDETLKNEISDLAEFSGAGKYMTGKLSDAEMTTLSEWNRQLETALILGTVKFTSGYGDIFDVLTKYGSNVGINGSIKTEACLMLSGNDYDADDIAGAYNSFASPNKPGGGGSGGGGGGGSYGGESNRTPAVSSHASVVKGSGTVEERVEETYLFTDLTSSHWAYDSVKWLKENGIVSGTDTGSFEPDRTVTREEFTKMIVLACGLKAEGDTIQFADAEDGAWYLPYISTATANGIVNGINENIFGIGQNITRQDMAVMVKRALNSIGTELNKIRDYAEFEDEAAFADYAKDAIKELFEAGIINGKGENNFDPVGSATRAEAAKIIYEACK